MHGKIFSLQGLLPGTGGISLALSSGGIRGNAGWKWYWVYMKKLRRSSLSMQELFLSCAGKNGSGSPSDRFAISVIAWLRARADIVSAIAGVQVSTPHSFVFARLASEAIYFVV